MEKKLQKSRMALEKTTQKRREKFIMTLETLE